MCRILQRICEEGCPGSRSKIRISFPVLSSTLYMVAGVTLERSWRKEVEEFERKGRNIEKKKKELSLGGRDRC